MSDIRRFEPLWGTWRVDGKPIGEGSFGTVYRVTREEFGKRYYAAVKHISIPSDENQIASVISEGIARDIASAKNYFDAITQNLVNEISLMNLVKGHTNIVSYEDHLIIPKTTGVGYDVIIRMELLTALSDVLIRRKLSNRDIIKLGIDICTALEICLEKGIIHRDIKPSNIFVNDTGDYKLGDFGVARELEHTTSGMSKKGTYVYMAPEVYRGEPANFTADTYSLGIVMYRLLNGNRVPFLPADTPSISPADNEMALARRMSGEQLTAPAYAESPLAAVVLRATQFDKARRFASPTEFKKALQNIGSGAPANIAPPRGVPASAPGNISPPRSVPERRPVPSGFFVPAGSLSIDRNPADPVKSGQPVNPAASTPPVSSVPPAVSIPPVSSAPPAVPVMDSMRSPAVYYEPLEENGLSAVKTDRRIWIWAAVAAVLVVVGLTTIIIAIATSRREEIFIGGQTVSTDVTELDLRNTGIEDISDLKHCRDLVYLDLGGNYIEDISVLENCTRLTELYLDDNYIEDISVLSRCTKLEILDVGYNFIEDLSPLSGLDELVYLNAEANYFTTLQPIAKCVNLEYIDVCGVEISDWHLLTGLPHLEYIGLSCDDLSEVECLTNARVLYLDSYISWEQENTYPQIDLSSLAQLRKLESLMLADYEIPDISPLTALTGLQSMAFYNCSGVNDLSGLASLDNLYELWVYDDTLDGIKGIDKLTGLTVLSIGGSREDLSFIAKLTELESLEINDCHIDDLSFLTGLHDLTELSFCDCYIAEIDTLCTLNGLEYLYIENSGLTQWQIVQIADALPNCQIEYY